jgi:hypothetical protein
MGGWLTVIGIEVVQETKNAATMADIPIRKRTLPFIKALRFGFFAFAVKIPKSR